MWDGAAPRIPLSVCDKYGDVLPQLSVSSVHIQYKFQNETHILISPLRSGQANDPAAGLVTQLLIDSQAVLFAAERNIIYTGEEALAFISLVEALKDALPSPGHRIVKTTFRANRKWWL